MDIFERQELERQAQPNQIENDLKKEREADLKKKQENSGKGEEKGSLPSPSAALSAFTEVDFGQDWAHFLIITLSIVADFFSLIPFLGAATGILFSVTFYTLYLLTGQLKNRVAAKMLVSSIAYFLEIVGGVFLIGMLPFFTSSAVLIYWVELSHRKARKKNAHA